MKKLNYLLLVVAAVLAVGCTKDDTPSKKVYLLTKVTTVNTYDEQLADDKGNVPVENREMTFYYDNSGVPYDIRGNLFYAEDKFLIEKKGETLQTNALRSVAAYQYAPLFISYFTKNLNGPMVTSWSINETGHDETLSKGEVTYNGVRIETAAINYSSRGKNYRDVQRVQWTEDNLTQISENDRRTVSLSYGARVMNPKLNVDLNRMLAPVELFCSLGFRERREAVTTYFWDLLGARSKNYLSKVEDEKDIYEYSYTWNHDGLPSDIVITRKSKSGNLSTWVKSEIHLEYQTKECHCKDA